MEDHPKRRASDRPKWLQKILVLLASFVLWWAGGLYKEYREGNLRMDRQATEISTLQVEVKNLRTTVEDEHQLSSEQRAEMIAKIDRVDGKLDTLISDMRRWRLQTH